MWKFIPANRRLLLALATGLLLALSWPARGFPFLAFVAFIPLLFLEEELFRQRKTHSALSFTAYAWTAFFIFNLFTTWWIMFATIPGMIVAVLLNSIFMTIPWWLMHTWRRLLGSKQGPAPLVIFWLAFEYMHGRWELSWSWLDTGNVFAAYPAWVQWYEFTGTAGGTLWVLGINLLLFAGLKQYFEHGLFTKKFKWYTGLAIAIFLLPSVVSWFMWHNHEETSAPVEVVIIQPAEDPYDPVSTEAEAAQRVEKMIRLANSKIPPDTRFVVAPEAANPRGVWKQQDESHPTIIKLREHIKDYPGLSWVMGSFTYRLYPPGDPPSPTARPYGNTGQHYDSFNSAIMVEQDQPVQYYHKSKLVPGIERMPYFTLLAPLSGLVDRFGGIAGSLGTQDDRSVFETGDGIAIAPAVCYESIYGEYMGRYMQKGATLLFVVTNDGWWRDPPGYRQHNQYARLRAIESRRSIARSASTGISSFINQKGEITAEIPWGESGAMVSDLNKNSQITFFTRTGNYLGSFAAFLSALLLLYMISQYVIQRSHRKLLGG